VSTHKGADAPGTIARQAVARRLRSMRDRGLILGRQRVHFHGKFRTVDEILGWLQVVENQRHG